MNFNFYMPSRVISGEDCVRKHAQELASLGSRCLIVTSAGSARASGALEDVTATLRRQKIEYALFDQVGQNPLVSVCCEAGTQARGFGADFIIGIGGGSALDAAKAAAVFATNPGLLPEEIFRGFAKAALPICLVGTTAGTGSEVTSIAVLTIDSRNFKKSISSPHCFARLVFADPRYTHSCPRDITVSTALDTMCHAIEGYYSARANDAARAFALTAVGLVWPHLRKLREDPQMMPDSTGREALYYGSLWAGLTINLAGTCFPHAAGYALTSGHGILHGRACAVLLPAFVRRNAPADPALTARLFAALGCGVEEFCDDIASLTGLEDLRLTSEQCEAYARGLSERSNLQNAIRPSTPEELEAIYKALFLK
ncbi:MAG: iron-containing alcohol dehydrogenase [Clostridia bacterium]|nr:iron-containing alcohol dehydrogenase [Clostridia bacterium]